MNTLAASKLSPDQVKIIVTTDSEILHGQEQTEKLFCYLDELVGPFEIVKKYNLPGIELPTIEKCSTDADPFKAERIDNGKDVEKDDDGIRLSWTSEDGQSPTNSAPTSTETTPVTSPSNIIEKPGLRELIGKIEPKEKNKKMKTGKATAAAKLISDNVILTLFTEDQIKGLEKKLYNL